MNTMIQKTMIALLAGTSTLLVACATSASADVAPAPVASAPVASAPVTAAPVTAAPVTQQVPKSKRKSPVRVFSQTKVDFISVDEVNLKLRAGMVSSGKETAFNQKLIQRLAGNVLSVAELASGDSGDVKIVLSSDFEHKDSEGEYRRIRCVQVNVAIFSQGRQIATKVVEPREMQRVKGEQAAKDQYLPAVVAEIAPFLQKELLALSKTELAVSELNFTLARKQKKSSTASVAAEINKLKQAFDQMDGVINYTITKQDVKNATCSFRIVYQKRQFPQGLANALNHALSSK